MMSDSIREGSDSSFEELADKTIENIDISKLGSFEEIAVESFQELEKYNEQELSSGDLQRLLEKTRHRREVLNQKLGKTPDVTPRKRILEQNLARENVPAVSLTAKDGSPGKRQCVRDEEQLVHPDTPAINGVKSRMQTLAKQREHFSEMETDVCNSGKEVPVQNNITSQREEAGISKENVGETGAPSGRRGRFAHLAQTISTWEDDLSHPTIHKPEEPKPRWQPPKPDSVTGPLKPAPVKTTPSPPQSSVKPPPAPPAPVVPSPKKTHAPPPPTTTASKQWTNCSSKPEDRKPQLQKERQEEATSKSVSERLNSWKSSETPKKEKPVDPSEQPVSAKKAVWEQKISTPTASVSRVQHPVRQMATPISDKPPLSKPQFSESKNPSAPTQAESRVEKGDPAAQPVSARMASWQQRMSESTPRKEDEPTAYSVNARMSAWEEMSSSNKVSYIKKVDPSSVSPGKKSPVKAPVYGSAKKSTPVKAIGQTTENKMVTPSKSVKENILQKADHIKAATESPVKTEATPGKIGSATKIMQQKLLEQVSHGKTADTAEKMRRERMEEVQLLQNRHQNGILKEEVPTKEKTPSDTEDQKLTKDIGDSRREVIRAKARADDSSDASYDFKEKQGQPTSQAKPPVANSTQSKSNPSPSIYRLISQKRNEKPSMPGNKDRKSDDSFDSTEDEELYTRRPLSSTQEEKEEEVVSSTDEGMQRQPSESESDIGPRAPLPLMEEDDSDSDDVSFSAFVPASVRRQSVLPSGPQKEPEQRENRPKPTINPVASVPSSCRSGSNLVVPQQQTSSSSLESTSSDQSSYSTESREYSDTEDDESSENQINDLLDEAMSDEEEETGKPRAAPRKRRSHMMATSEENAGNLAYSVSMYRSRRYLHESNSPKKRIIRNREFEDSIHEENIEMPTQLPPELERKSIQERIQELQELVSQEQSVIMQTSNALNQCCSSNSYFQGSPEQVECNRLLLIACQKRQAYLTEIQRLKESGCLDPPGSGPRGSLTISDIRLPLKKEFVTKIGTGSDNTVHYFLLLIRNHAQVIVTQMLSTHDPMMRGSLDFPNLIKIHGICGNFKLNLEIYSMSISREAIKDKKRKTPKKAPKGHLAPAPSPGGPTAVRTTSFTLITTLPITMRALDKTCFTLERIPYLSPLHGTIYMRLKCLMEQNVEERGFLTMFEDVSGFGAWHRRWTALQGNKLCFWKYPDEENRKEPMGIIDLKRCVTEKVGLIPRDICARPNTFELVTVRQPRRGEEDTLISKTYNTMTTIRHMISADTKEERINWCNKINRALANIRTWHSDALRPVRMPKTTE
ncbi:anillin-like isoform X2 [Saccostrea echinata]|uniref:anillin-like isoform X2 n=1 Tax=Saccostrea echinata TaxID=191078 RepID=UPI002A80741A|nr:anillin-like isoform X2 [Saccostrea echinata]